MTDGAENATYHSTGSGRLTVTEDHSGTAYTFRVTGRTNSITIADHEATALAETILERNR